MPEFEIGLDVDEMNFNQLFLNFNVKKKIQSKNSSQFDFQFEFLLKW